MILAAPKARAHCGPPVPLRLPQGPKKLSFFDAFIQRASATFSNGRLRRRLRREAFGTLLPLALAMPVQVSLAGVTQGLWLAVTLLLSYE